MEQSRQIKQFQFYDFYAGMLNGLNDEESGRMARLMCEYMFTDSIVPDVKDDKERFYWGNIVDVLIESKENEINGKQSTGLNRKMKHFTFQDNFYDAIKLLDDKQSGQYIKAICGYMFDNKTPTLKPPSDSFFTLAKRKLDLSKTRKRIGSKGGKTEKIPVTVEQVNAADTMRGQSIGMDGFLKRNPHVKNDIYKSSMHLTSCIDWTTLDCELPYSEYRDSTSLYQILTHYKEIIGR